LSGLGIRLLAQVEQITTLISYRVVRNSVIRCIANYVSVQNKPKEPKNNLKTKKPQTTNI